MITAGMMSSASAEHYTPPEFLRLIEWVAPIGLDPCWSPKSLVRPRITFTAAEDGLVMPWDCTPDELIFVNSPYGRDIGPWQSKCAAVGERGHTVLSLVPSRTDAKWFQDAARQADVTCFLRGRLAFWTDQYCPTCAVYKRCTKAGHESVTVEAAGEGDVAPFPSAVLMWGPPLRVDRFATAFRSEGLVYIH